MQSDGRTAVLYIEEDTRASLVDQPQIRFNARISIEISQFFSDDWIKTIAAIANGFLGLSPN
jgi:hypothetical protein